MSDHEISDSHLNAVVPIRVAQKLFETSPVEEFIDKHFTGIVLGDTNTLEKRKHQ